MDQILFFIIVALAAGLLVWTVSRLLLGGGKDRLKLFRRLSGDGQLYRAAGAGTDKSILLQSPAESSSLSKALGRKSYFANMQRKLATVAPRMTLARFLLIGVGIGLFFAMIVFAVSGNLLFTASVGALGFYLPSFSIYGRVNKRNRLLNEQLPEALDFLARILRSGHSLSTGLQMMGTELPEPLAHEFRRCYDQHSLGQPLEDSLKDVASRVESTDFAFFVTAVLIQRQTGGDLASVLGNISNMVRSRMRLASYVKAKTAEGRFTGYILVAFPVLMFFVAYAMNPDYGGKLLYTETGRKLIGTAIGLQVLGLVSIRKLTTVKV